MMTNEQCERFIDHVNAPVMEGGHGFTLGIDAPIVSLGPSWHYHEHVHMTKEIEHTHKANEFGIPTPPTEPPRLRTT